jgi:hypothetical protein
MSSRVVETLTEPLVMGSATGKKWVYPDGFEQFENGAYDDLRIELNSSRQGANLLPAYDFANCGLLFPQNDTSEIAHANEEFTHEMKSGTPIYPHVHFIQTSAQIPIFKMLFRWYGNGDLVPAFAEYATSGTGVFAYSGGQIMQMTYFPEIPAIANGLSSHIDIKLWRDDNLVSGNVLAKFFDIHFLKDTLGSRTQGSKL